MKTIIVPIKKLGDFFYVRDLYGDIHSFESNEVEMLHSIEYKGCILLHSTDYNEVHPLVLKQTVPASITPTHMVVVIEEEWQEEMYSRPISKTDIEKYEESLN